MHLRRSVAACAATALAAAGLVAAAGTSNAATGGVLVYGLTETNRIVQFRAETGAAEPGTSSVAVAVAVGEDIVGIDIRPATGELYGVVNGPTADRLIVIDPSTGAIVREAPLSTQLSGVNFGVDFNPVPDRLRIVSDSEQNLRVNPDTGAATVDGALAYAAGDPRAGTNPSVRAAGYTNNVAGVTTTQLFDIDVEGPDALALQNPPNDGTLQTRGNTGRDVATQTAGIAPATSTAAVGLDIEAVTNRALALIEEGGVVRLFDIKDRKSVV